jgi:uncharacterized membrane protein YkgB
MHTDTAVSLNGRIDSDTSLMAGTIVRVPSLWRDVVRAVDEGDIPVDLGLIDGILEVHVIATNTSAKVVVAGNLDCYTTLVARLSVTLVMPSAWAHV